MGSLAQLLANVLGVEPGMLFENRSFAEQSIGEAELDEFADVLQQHLGTRPPDMIRVCTTLEQLHGWLAGRSRTEISELHLELGFVEGLPDPLFYE